jgi:CheY-like chemotaxis protein
MALSLYNIRNIVEASDGAQGLDILEREHVDIVLLDNEMEPISGIEHTRLIRTGGKVLNRKIPIIMISGFTEAGKVIEARNAGVDEYLAKPISASILCQRVEQTYLYPRPFIECDSYVGPCRRWIKAEREQAERRQQQLRKAPAQLGHGLAGRVGMPLGMQPA